MGYKEQEEIEMKKVLLLIVLLLIIATLMAGCANCKCVSKITRDDVKSFAILDISSAKISCDNSCGTVTKYVYITKKYDDGIIIQDTYTESKLHPKRVLIYTDIDNSSEAWGFIHLDQVIVHIPEEWAETRGLN
ncbi:MAG: hypothetical protein WC909_01840 [Candidatus Paceibacterota bacterium]|jgi:hypothetical protein